METASFSLHFPPADPHNHAGNPGNLSTTAAATQTNLRRVCASERLGTADTAAIRREQILGCVLNPLVLVNAWQSPSA